MGRFNGEGFSQEPLSPAEAARMRHMLKEVGEEWMSVDSAVTLVKAVQILFGIIRVGGPVAAAMAVLGAYGRAQGWW